MSIDVTVCITHAMPLSWRKQPCFCNATEVILHLLQTLPGSYILLLYEATGSRSVGLCNPIGIARASWLSVGFCGLTGRVMSGVISRVPNHKEVSIGTLGDNGWRDPANGRDQK